MSTANISDFLGTICVLDIETAPDPLALAIAGKRSGSSDASAALHFVRDASLLIAREGADGNWGGFELHSFDADRHSEERLLTSINQRLQALWTTQGTLVTYNGVAHDAVVLARRAARHLMFDASGIAAIHRERHLDLMLMTRVSGDGRWSKLRDVAAGLGIPTAHQMAQRGMDAATLGIRKSQTDVAMTFLVLLYELAMRRGDAGPVVQGWRAFGKFIARMGPHGEHLAQYRRHPLGGALEAH